MSWQPRETPCNGFRRASFDRIADGDHATKAKVSISRGFWIAQYETTQAEWMRLMPSNPSHVTGSPFLPVDSVSWDDVAKFCSLLNQQESHSKRLPAKYTYRLPTEFEWEYACRAGKPGDFAVDPGGFWCVENSEGRPHEVGEGTPNAWNLYDMHGNAQEWCLDAWQDDPDLRGSDVFKPRSNAGEYLVVRGGGWWIGRRECSSVARDRWRNEPGGYRGFRLVLGPATR